MNGAHRGTTTSEAEFRRLWNDPSLTLAQIGQRLNITQQAVCHRAKRRGLTNARPMGTRPTISDDATFRRLWAAGVTIPDMAAHFGVHEKTIRNHVARLDLPRRGCSNSASISLDAYRAAIMRARLDAEAAETRAAMHLSDMVDRFGRSV